MYEVYLESKAERDFKRLSPYNFSQIIAHVKALAKNPRPKGSHKLAGSKIDWRIRIGEYRVLYEIHRKQKKVKIMRIKHRREVYRK